MEILVTLILWLQDEKLALPYEGTVTVQEACVRQTQRSLSKIVATLKEKEKVTVLELKDRKARVRTAAGIEGWVDERSVLETKAYVAKEQAAGGDPTKGAESHAYAKGFDPETESRLKSQKNLGAQYAALDKLEATPAFRRDARELDRRLVEFRKAGRLGEFHP